MFARETGFAQTAISLVCKSWLTGPVVAWRVSSTVVLYKKGKNNETLCIVTPFNSVKFHQNIRIIARGSCLFTQHVKKCHLNDNTSIEIKQDQIRKLIVTVKYYHLRAAIKESVVIHHVPVVLNVSRVIKLTFPLSCRTVRIFFNINTDTVVMLVTEKFTLVQVLNMLGFYLVVLQTFISKEVVAWEVQFTISSWN